MQFDRRSSETFDIRSGVNEDCVFAPRSLGYYLPYSKNTDGIYLWIRSTSRLFNLIRFGAKTKVFYTVAVTQNEQDLQALVNFFYQAHKDFGPIISLKNTKVWARTKLNQRCSPVHLPQLNHHQQPLPGK